MEIQVNLPPGLIEKAASSIGVNLDEGSISALEAAVQKRNEENRLQMKQAELIKAQKYPAAADLGKQATGSKPTN